jgi:hypothetical protein
LEQSLKFRLSHPIIAQTESSKSRALQRIEKMLPEEKRSRLADIYDARPPDIDFRLDLSSQLNHFRPDLKFRFSLSPSGLLHSGNAVLARLKRWAIKDVSVDASSDRAPQSSSGF